MDRKPVEGSSNVVSAGYDPGAKLLEVEYKGGGVYQYHDIPEEDWRARIEPTLSSADSSTGRAVIAVTRNRAYRKV